SCEQDERRQERKPDRSRDERQPGDGARLRKAPTLRKRERREAEKEEEGLRVDGLEKECGGEEREVEHGAPSACHAEPLLREPLEEHERRERRRERDEHTREHIVSTE